MFIVFKLNVSSRNRKKDNTISSLIDSYLREDLWHSINILNYIIGLDASSIYVCHNEQQKAGWMTIFQAAKQSFPFLLSVVVLAFFIKQRHFLLDPMVSVSALQM